MGPLNSDPRGSLGPLISLGGPLDAADRCEGPQGPLSGEGEGPVGPLTACTREPADLLNVGGPPLVSLSPICRQIEGSSLEGPFLGPQGENSWQLKRLEEAANEVGNEEGALENKSKSDATSEDVYLIALEAIAAADEAAAAVAAMREWRQQQQQQVQQQQQQQAAEASSSADSSSSACKQSGLMRQVDTLVHAVLGAPDDLCGGPPSSSLHRDWGPPSGGLVSNIAAAQQQSSSLQHLLSEARSSVAAAAADGVYVQLTQQQQGLAEVPQAPRLHAELALLEARTMVAASAGNAAGAAAAGA
ncbi:hypothetical protein Esti_001621 [Eimeria stiedai]